MLHVCVDKSVAHVRAHYDTVFEDLASSTRLENEAWKIHKLDHPGIVRVRHFGQSDGVLFFAMDYMPGLRGPAPTLALRLEELAVGTPRASGDAPVDGTHVVTRLIRADFRELEAWSAEA